MPPLPVPTGTVTFLFTDIEGSTRLWEAYPDAMQATLARHDTIFRACIERYDGYVFKTIGDAFCAAFTTATEAINAVLAAQLGLKSEPWPEQISIKVRMALHTGAVESRNLLFPSPTRSRFRLLKAFRTLKRCNCLLPAPSKLSQALPSPMRMRLRWRPSVFAWMGFRLPLSWPPPAPGRSRSRTSTASSTSVSGC